MKASPALPPDNLPSGLEADGPVPPESAEAVGVTASLEAVNAAATSPEVNQAEAGLVHWAGKAAMQVVHAPARVAHAANRTLFNLFAGGAAEKTQYTNMALRTFAGVGGLVAAAAVHRSGGAVPADLVHQALNALPGHGSAGNGAASGQLEHVQLDAKIVNQSHALAGSHTTKQTDPSVAGGTGWWGGTVEQNIKL